MEVFGQQGRFSSLLLPEPIQGPTIPPMMPSASEFASGICTNFSFAEKLIMVIGGWQSDDIEIAAPDCLSELSPFPFGAIIRATGGTTVPGQFINS